jgi:hypothetical protein
MMAQKRELDRFASAAEESGMKIKDLEEELEESNFKVHRNTCI